MEKVKKPLTWLCALILTFPLSNCSSKPRPGDWSGLPKEPIDVIVQQLAGESEIWLNGAFHPIELPENAPPEKILAQLFSGRTFPRGRVSEYQIQDTRDMTLPDIHPSEVYQVLKVQTNLGDLIVLLRYTPQHYWWSRVIGG